MSLSSRSDFVGLFRLAVATSFLAGCNGSPSKSAQIELSVEHVYSIGPEGRMNDADQVDEHTFGTIGGIAIDSRDNLYVFDRSDNRIASFNAQGEKLGVLQLTIGKGPGEVGNVRGFDVDDEGKIVMISRDARTIYTVDSSGVQNFPIDFSPTSITLEKDKVFLGRSWFSNDPILNVMDRSRLKESVQIDKHLALVHRPENWEEIAATGNVGRYFVNATSIMYAYPIPNMLSEISTKDGSILKQSSTPHAFDAPFSQRMGSMGRAITSMKQGIRALTPLRGGFILSVVMDYEKLYADIYDQTLAFRGRFDLEKWGISSITDLKTDSEGFVYMLDRSSFPIVKKLEITVSKK